MGKIYDSQTALAIVARYKTSLPATVVSAKIKYKTPSGRRNYFIAIHDLGTKTFTYNIPSNAPLEESGYWLFWVEATLSDSRIAIGEPFRVMIYNEGQ